MLPVGIILPFASDKPPTGYLICDGASISREEYPELFILIETKFGNNDDKSFNFPN